MIHLPEKFIQAILGVHQEKGELWLRNFDDLIKYCEEKWKLQISNPYTLSYNYVAHLRLTKVFYYWNE